MPEGILGCDISKWEGKVDFKRMKDAGAEWVYFKVSQGNWLDKTFSDSQSWKAAKDAGLLRGGYHYLDWSKSWTVQAQTFCDAIEADPGELPPVCDFEEPPMEGIKGAGPLWEFCKYTKKRFGRCMIYTSPGYWQEHGNANREWTEFPLWIANTQVVIPWVPPPWRAYTYWQYTFVGDGRLYGCSSKGVDLNVFNGTRKELYALAGQVAPDENSARFIALEKRMTAAEAEIKALKNIA